MSKYILYGHDGSNNHGCEALVRSTVMLLEDLCNDITLISTAPEEDEYYHLNQLCKIIKRGECGQVNRNSLAFLRAYSDLKLRKNSWAMDAIHIGRGANIHKNDIALSIGGDSYCYGTINQQQLINEHNIWKYNGLKTVLWGCSIEPKLLEDEDMAEDIRQFDLITVRESISYEAIKKSILIRY